MTGITSACNQPEYAVMTTVNTRNVETLLTAAGQTLPEFSHHRNK